MPTIIVDKNKGLFQKAATSANKAGTLSGNLNSVKAVVAGDSLTLADSGKLFLVGGGAGTIQVPISDAGWHGTFVITGAVEGDVIISGSAAALVSQKPTFITTIVTEGSATPDAIAAVGTSAIKFTTSNETAGDRIDVKVAVANNLIIGTGFQQS